MWPGIPVLNTEALTQRNKMQKRAMAPTVANTKFLLVSCHNVFKGFTGGSDNKASACNAVNLGWIPGLGRSPGEGNGYSLQYSCWRIPWTQEPGRLQSMGWQSQTQLSD